MGWQGGHDTRVAAHLRYTRAHTVLRCRYQERGDCPLPYRHRYCADRRHDPSGEAAERVDGAGYRRAICMRTYLRRVIRDVVEGLACLHVFRVLVTVQLFDLLLRHQLNGYLPGYVFDRPVIVVR